MTVVIRNATAEDVALVQSIGHETYREHFSHIWSPAGLDEFLARSFSEVVLRESISSQGHLWLLVHDSAGGVIGYAKVNWDSREQVSGVIGAELQKIYLVASATGKGYGAMAMEHITSAAAARGQAAVWLNVLESNRDGQRFYQSCGFEPVGKTKFSTDIAEFSLVAMVRRLAN